MVHIVGHHVLVHLQKLLRLQAIEEDVRHRRDLVALIETTAVDIRLHMYVWYVLYVCKL